MPPKSFAELSLAQQQAQLKSADLWNVTRAMGDRESDGVRLVAEHGPSGTEVSRWPMPPDAESSMALYLARVTGTLGEVDRSILASKCPSVSWDTFAEVLAEVSDFLDKCTRKDEIALMADVVTQHRWPKGQEELRLAFDKEPASFRRLLNQAQNPVAAGRVMMSWLWFWQAVDAAWARRKGLKVSWLSSPADASGLPLDNPVSDTKLSQAIKSAMPSMLPHPRVPERRANDPPPSAPDRAKRMAGPGSVAQPTRLPTALPHFDDNQRLASELQSAWDTCQGIPPEHIRAAATNLQLRMAPLPSMAAALRTLAQASTGKQLGTILTSQAGHFGADSGAAATAIAEWRAYLEDKRLLQATPTTKQELLEEAEEILAAQSADWEWKTLGAHVAVAGARQGLPGPFVDALMQADTLDTFWHAYVQFVVHVPDVSTIRDTNDHLRTNAGAHLVPHWAARYYDRVPGAPRGHRDSSPSPERTARGSRERDRPSSRSNRKRTSPSPEERYVSLRLEGLLGLPPAEVAAAVSAALAHPTTVPDWAPHEGSCSVVVPHEAWRRAARGSDSHPAETASGAYVLIRREAHDDSPLAPYGGSRHRGRWRGGSDEDDDDEPPSLSRDLRSGYHRQLGRRRSYDSPEHTTYHRQPYATYQDRAYRSPPSRERSPRGGFPPPPPGPPPAGRRQHRDGTPPLTTAAISPGSRGRKASRSGQSVRSRRETAAPGPRRESSGLAWGAGPDKATARAVRVESVPGKKGKSQ